MEQLIDKSAVVAEIRKYIKSAEAFLKYHHNKKDRLCYSYEHQRLAMCELLSFLNTLETKEVDLEKGVKDYIYALPHSRTGIPGGWRCSWPEEEVIKIAKHFFELGLKSKGEKV